MLYIDQLPETAKKDEIRNIHQQRQDWVNQPKKGFLRYRIPFEILQNYPAKHLDFTGDSVTIGSVDEISKEQQKELETALRDFSPWRKGPFSVFGIEVNSEWQSQRKWKRLLPHLPNMKGKIDLPE